jgi:hypothetical protein
MPLSVWDHYGSQFGPWGSNLQKYESSSVQGSKFGRNQWLGGCAGCRTGRSGIPPREDLWLAPVMAVAMFLSMILAGLSGVLIPPGAEVVRNRPSASINRHNHHHH